MDCKKVRKLLSNYLDGQCSARTEFLIRKHLQECAECLQEYRALNEFVTIVQSIPSQPISEKFESDLMSKIRTEQEVYTSNPFSNALDNFYNLIQTRKFYYAFSSLVAVIGFAFIVSYLFNPGNNSTTVATSSYSGAATEKPVIGFPISKGIHIDLEKGEIRNINNSQEYAVFLKLLNEQLNGKGSQSPNNEMYRKFVQELNKMAVSSPSKSQSFSNPPSRTGGQTRMYNVSQ